jgi:hypothetical protein
VVATIVSKNLTKCKSLDPDDNNARVQRFPDIRSHTIHVQTSGEFQVINRIESLATDISSLPPMLTSDFQNQERRNPHRSGK